MIYLHTGCRFSEPWDEGLQFVLNQWGIPYKLCQLGCVSPQTERDIFIGRLNESCLDLKEHYSEYTKGFWKVWPERLAMKLYDDKLIQALFLQRYPTPKFHLVLDGMIPKGVRFPVVQKKASGSSSKNVRLVHSSDEVESPCLLQEFCDGNDGDYRITIIGDYATGMKRVNRPNDFRASGSGNYVVLEDLPDEAVQLAYKICREHDFTTMAFDFLKLRDRWVIVEMSYTYTLPGILDHCKFAVDCRTGERISGPLRPIEMILGHFLQIKLL